MGRFKKGEGGRPKGVLNKTTKGIREAFQNLIEMNTENMGRWLERVAATDPAKALSLMGDLAEYTTPKLARTTHEFDPKGSVVFKLEMGKDLNQEKEKEPTNGES